MHSILPSIAARELDVTREQVFLFVKRGLLSGKRTEHGTRIKVDARWRRFKKTWKAEGVPTDAEGHALHATHGIMTARTKAAQERREITYALIDDGVSKEDIADRLGISLVTVQEYLRRRPHVTA